MGGQLRLTGDGQFVTVGGGGSEVPRLSPMVLEPVRSALMSARGSVRVRVVGTIQEA